MISESPGLGNGREQVEAVITSSCTPAQLQACPPLCACGVAGGAPQFRSATWAVIPVVILSSCATSCKSRHLPRPAFKTEMS